MAQPVNPLWEEYKNNRTNAVKEKIVLTYINLVKYVAGRMMFTLPPSVEVEDLESAGVMGLIDAIDRFDSKYGVKFESYAIPRIKGAMLDELRKLDWVPRSVRSKSRELEKTIAAIENDKGRPAEDEEIAQTLGVTMDEYFTLLRDVNTQSLLSLDNVIYDDEGSSGELHEVIKDKNEEEPDEKIKREELKQMIMRSIDDLPETERLVLALYYYEELTLKEIGQVLQLSESRISQIHTKTILSLRGKLQGAIKV